MSNINEAIKLLRHVKPSLTGPCGGWIHDEIATALSLLESGPEPTEFTKIQREAIKLCVDAYETEEWMSAGGVGIQRLAEACDIIDSLTAENKELEKDRDAHSKIRQRHLVRCGKQSTRIEELQAALKADWGRIIEIVKLQAQLKQNKFLLEHGTAALLKAKDKEVERLKPFERFYCHIEEHLVGRNEKVICKICGKSLDDIEQALKGE